MSWWSMTLNNLIPQQLKPPKDRCKEEGVNDGDEVRRRADEGIQ